MSLVRFLSRSLSSQPSLCPRAFLPVAAMMLFAGISACTETANEGEGEAKAESDAEQKPKIVSKAEWGKNRLKLEFLQRQVQKDPCNKRHALDLAEKLNGVKEYEMAIAAVDGYLEKCEAWPRILWPKSVALRYLKRPQEGAPVVTQIIEADKSDSDYWWWRGRHYAEAKDFDRAEADFRQSNANKPSGWGSGKMSGYLGDARPCESAFLILRYMEQSKKKVGDWAAPARTKHWVAGNCDALAGRGSTTIKWKKSAPVAKTKAKIGSEKTTAIVDTKAGLTVVNKALAEKLKLNLGPEVQTLGVGQILTGKIADAKISVGRANASAVKVLVVDAVPGGTDAILGQSFFVRFKNAEKPGSLRLAAR